MSKSYNTCLSITYALFFSLYLLLSYNSRLATDDYYFIGDKENHGIFEQVYFQYMNWTGRYSATFSTNLLYNIFGLKQIYYNFLPIATLIILISGVFIFLKKIFSLFQFNLNKKLLITYSFLFSTFLFFLSYDIGESWFWYCCYSSYLWSISALIWGAAFIISPNKNFISIGIIVFSFIYIGGASELYNSIILLIFTIFLYKLKRNKTFPNYIYKNAIIGYIAFCLAFLVLIIAPGNYLRDGLFPEHDFLYAFFITLKSVVKFCIIYLPSKLIYFIAFIPPFIVLGAHLKEKYTTNFEISFKKFFIKSSIYFITLLLIYFYLVAFVMVETGPARVMFFVSFLFSIYIIANSIFAGISLNIKNLNTIKYSSIAAGIMMLIFHIINQSVASTKYADAVDERINYILKLNTIIKNDTLIYLNPLPPSGMLYSGEISSDTNHFTNKELKMGYHLSFAVAKIQSTTSIKK